MSMKNEFFQNIFHEKQVQSKKQLDDFLKEPGEKQIHDLRTSIRRLQALYIIFPNSCKRKKTDYFVSSYNLLFKKNSSIRDLDVIFEKLLQYNLPKDSEIMQNIVKQKNKKLKKILKDAKKLSDLKSSKPKKIDNKKITQKHDKLIFSLLTKIENCLPIVLSDESKMKELHSMRKNAKKLRYILEIDPDKKYQHMVDNMKSFQTLLGIIHDCDITINFLKKYSKKGRSELIPLVIEEQKIRSETYRKLSDSLS